MKQNVNVLVGNCVNNTASCQYKTIVLKSKGNNGMQLLTQDMVSEPNVKYVVKFDFYIDDNIRKGTAQVNANNVSSCVNPEYQAALSEYESAHSAYIIANTNNENVQADPSSTEQQKASALEALNKAHALLVGAESTLLATPRYYYYGTSFMLNAGQVLIVPDGCVVLNSILNTCLNFSQQEGTVYIASTIPGIYSYKVMKHISVPDGCIFDFDGGSINNGAIEWNDTYVLNLCDRQILSQVVEQGNRYTWGGQI
jgi:hypothetical protein